MTYVIWFVLILLLFLINHYLNLKIEAKKIAMVKQHQKFKKIDELKKAEIKKKKAIVEKMRVKRQQLQIQLKNLQKANKVN